MKNKCLDGAVVVGLLILICILFITGYPYSSDQSCQHSEEPEPLEAVLYLDPWVDIQEMIDNGTAKNMAKIEDYAKGMSLVTGRVERIHYDSKIYGISNYIVLTNADLAPDVWMYLDINRADYLRINVGDLVTVKIRGKCNPHNFGGLYLHWNTTYGCSKLVEVIRE